MPSKMNVLGLTEVNLPTAFRSPVVLNDLSRVGMQSLGVEELKTPPMTLRQRPESHQVVNNEADSLEDHPCDPEIFTLLTGLIFQISNKLSTDDIDDGRCLPIFVHTLKTAAMSTSKWTDILTAGGGPTSRSLTDQLLEYSITMGDITLMEMSLQVGADPNHQIYQDYDGMCFPALEVALKRKRNRIASLLLDSGASYDKMSLKRAIIAGNIEIADRMLQSDSSLDVNFNYLEALDQYTQDELRHLKLETVTLLGLVCFHTVEDGRCDCNEASRSAASSHAVGCPMNSTIASLEYLLRQRAAITLDTMILASFSVDAVTLQFLIRHGGVVCGLNRLGFTCLAGASLSDFLQYDVFDLLLRSGATVNIPRFHHSFRSLASPFHYLCAHRRPHNHLGRYPLLSIIDLLIQLGADINDQVQRLASPSLLAQAYERLVWSCPSKHLLVSPIDETEQLQAESPLEYAIISGNEDVALQLLSRGCRLTGREVLFGAKSGLLALLKALLKHNRWAQYHGGIGTLCLRISLRRGYEMIVRFLIGEGVTIAEEDIMDDLQYPGISASSIQTQIELLRVTPDVERPQIFGVRLLELCFLKFTEDAVRNILRLFPAAYDSGALCAIVSRALRSGLRRENGFCITDIESMMSRCTESKRDWDKENRAILIAATFKQPEILRILVTPDTVCGIKKTRLCKENFFWTLGKPHPDDNYFQMELGPSPSCQYWVTCSPLMGIAINPDACQRIDWSVSEGMLDHLLACSYEPDALTVVIAAAEGELRLLRRLRFLENWGRIMSIDDHDRPPWCPTALQVAVSEKNDEIVHFLLDAGVSVNEIPASEPIRHRMPRTALQAAVENGNLGLTTLFIERGACINAPAVENSGATALQLACIHGYLAISLRLLELGADVNARGAQKNGRTALEGAAEHGRIDTIQLLLNYGVGTDGPHRDQYIKAVVHAEWNGHSAAALLLREHRQWSAEDQECYKDLQSYEWCDEW